MCAWPLKVGRVVKVSHKSGQQNPAKRKGCPKNGVNNFFSPGQLLGNGRTSIRPQLWFVFDFQEIDCIENKPHLATITVSDNKTEKVSDDLWNFGLVRTCNNTFATTAFTTIFVFTIYYPCPSFLLSLLVHIIILGYLPLTILSICLPSITFSPVLKGSWKTMFQKIIIDETPPTLQVPLMMMSSEVTGWSKVIVAGMLAFQASPPRSQSGRRLVGGPPEREQ